MAPVNTAIHHHRSTTKVDHKPFKSRFASKSALKDRAKGKIESHREDRGKRHAPHQQVMSKLARRNQARQLRLNHHEKKELESSIFQGQDGAAKHIAVIPLSNDASTTAVVEALNSSVDVESQISVESLEPIRVDRFRRNLLYLPAKPDLMNILDVCRLADWVLLVFTAAQQVGEQESALLRAIEGQGITNVAAVIEGLEQHVQPAKRSKHVSELRTTVNRYFPTLEKVSVLENKTDCTNLVRSFCTASTKGIRWRDERSWMLIESLNWDDTPSSPASDVVITGTIRGHGLNPDRLVHVPGWGEYRIRKITEVPRRGNKRKAEEISMDEGPKEWFPSDDQDDLDELAPEQAIPTDATSTMATIEHKGVLLDDHHYFSDDGSHAPAPPTRVPKGTSKYQSAWYLDDVSDSDSDIMDDELDAGDVEMSEDQPLHPEDGAVFNGADAMTDAGPSEYPQSEMHVDATAEEEARDLEEFRATRKTEAEEDLEFPDEIELHPNVLARERLAKYRGLKNLRTSEWNTAEDAQYEPLDYARLLQIPDYKRSRTSAAREALVGGVHTGLRVEVRLEAVPTSLKHSPQPISLFSLLRHEHKHTVVNLNMTLHSASAKPLKSKDELIVQIGPRRLVINPVFSAAGVTPNDVHKFDRFLHPGRSATATFTGPLTWGSVPVLVFKREALDQDDVPMLVDSTSSEPQAAKYSNLQLIGTATTVPPSHSRVIAKRVILTGHPFKIHKKLVTIRYMFFNREDVAWFAALPLWTKRGRQGFIKESLGTHGYFKATFDGKINPMDAVGVSLYKRVWPRPSSPWRG